MAALRYQPYVGKGAGKGFGKGGGGQPPRTKTKLCSFFIERGTCAKGEFCNFAHDESELQPDPSLEAAWVPGNLDSPLQVPAAGEGAADGLHGPRLLKTKMCTFFVEQGSCVKGAACNFAHFPEELRSDPFAPIADAGGAVPGAASPTATILPAYGVIAPVAAPGRLLKTKMCSFFVERGSCSKGASCNFAHFPEELQDPDLAAQQAMLSGGSSGSLALAMAPQAPQAFQGPVVMYKSKMCSFFVEKGTCAKGADCNFAHFPEELQGGPLSPLQRGPMAGPILPPQSKMPFADARAPQSRAKTKMCSFFVERGSCAKGDHCDFAHYDWELQGGGCPADASPAGMNFANGGAGAKHTCPRCGHCWKDF